MDWFHQFRIDENQALKDIYRLYRKECLSFVRRKFGLSAEDATDVFQQSVLVLYHNTASGKLTSLTTDIKAYLYGILRLKALEAMRSTSKTIYPEDLNATLASVPDVPADEESEMVAVIKLLLPQLGLSCRQLLDQFYYKGLSISEIAAMGNYSGTDSVKTQKFKCIKRLHSMIMEHIRVHKN